MGTIRLGKEKVLDSIEEVKVAEQEAIGELKEIGEKIGEKVKEKLESFVEQSGKMRRRSGVLKGDPSVLYEKKELRSRNTKSYMRNDGTMKTVITNHAMHYVTAEGELAEIDNTMEDRGEVFETKAGKYKIALAKNTQQNGTVSMKSEDVSIEWNFLPQRAVKACAVVSESEEEISGKKLGDTVVYEDAEEKINLEYEISGENVKERIVVRERKEGAYRYSFELKIKGVAPRLSEDGTKIEFYRETVDQAENKSELKEAEIPAPFMYDAIGERSDNVYYELEPMEEGKYFFIVVADENWINDEERQFPVVLDPQIVTNDSSFIKATATISDYYTSTGKWSEETIYDNYHELLIVQTPKRRVTSKAIFNFKSLHVLNEPIVSAKLFLPFTFKESEYHEFFFNGTLMTYGGDKTNETFEFDIRDKLSSNRFELSLEQSPSSHGASALVNAHCKISDIRVEIEYLIHNDIPDTQKKISLVGGATVSTNLYTGESVVSFTDVPASDSLLGVGISHLHKITGEEKNCGKNFRLSLQERLIKNTNNQIDANYIYIDATGKKYGFKDTYYYLDVLGNKVYLRDDQKGEIAIDLDQKLTYDGYEVFKEQQTVTGLRAVTQIEGFNGSELLEQRIDERKQLDEKIKSYRDALDQFVLCDELGGEPVILQFGGYHWPGKLFGSNNTDNYLLFIYTAEHGDYFVMSDSERLNIMSLDQQMSSLEKQKTQYFQQLDSYEDSRTSLEHQIGSYKCSIEQYKDSKIKEAKQENRKCEIDEENDEFIKVNNALIADCETQKSKIDGQKSLCMEFIAGIDEQMELIELQKNAILDRSANYLAQVIQYYKEYRNLVHQLEQLKRQIPVNYLTDGKIIKGFNEAGNLVVIYDKYKNAISVMYDDEGKITDVYDGAEERITLEYNNNNFLTAITDTRGRTTKYEYDAESNLTKVCYASGKTLSFGYDEYGNITQVVSSDKLQSQLAYSSGLKSVTYKSTAGAITHGAQLASGSACTLNTVTLGYTANRTVLTDANGNKQYYLFDDDGNFTGYYEETMGVVTKGEKYEYKAYEKKETLSVPAELLNKYAFGDSRLIASDLTSTTLDQFNNPERTSVSEKLLYIEQRDGMPQYTYAETITEYKYDNEHRCIREETTTMLSGLESDTYTSITTYAYNAAGSLVRKENWIEGEEYTSGKTIEETVYDKDGHAVKSFSYNSLDASSKFYTESSYSEQGQVTAEKGETGETSVEYDYIEGTTVVRSEKRANGSTFAYGRDIDDTVTSITQSTAEGEENSTQLAYTLGELTELKSGNNVVRYSYDEKRRKNAVSLNGVENYMQYEYSADNLTVTETNVKGERFTTVTNKRGDVVKVSYNDTAQVTNAYENGRLKTTVDGVTQKTANYTYDSLGNVTKYTRGDYVETTAYNNYGAISEYNQNGCVYQFTYKKNAARDFASVSVEGVTVTPETDVLGRDKGKEISIGGKKLAGEYLYYRKVGDHATNMPSAVYFGGIKNGKFAISDNVKYEYDKNGNICKIFENGALAVRYECDSIDRLVREDNKKLGFTALFAYDNCGNIISKRMTKFTLKANVEECEFEEILYSYDGDKLLSFGNEVCECENVVYPTIYRGKEVEWEKGRQMKSFDGNTFSYDGNGRRIGKNGITYTYDSTGRLIASSNGLEFLYDHAGVLGIKNNGETYIYRRDAQGNITALLDSAGNVVVKYLYDAWGNHAVLNANGEDISDDSTHVGNLNPFRYRGYFYDVETGLYYLQTRYYDPEVGRFIVIDGIEYLDPETINGLNLYAYCGNNPVMFTDPNGTTRWWEWLLAVVVTGVLIVAAVATTILTGGLAAAVFTGAAIGATFSLASQAISGNLNWGQFALDIGVGALTGALGASGISQSMATVLGGVIGGASSIASDLINGKKINWAKFGISVVLGGLSGYIGGAGAKNTKAFQNSLKDNAGWQKALASFDKVQGKIASGAYNTIQGAKGALSIVERNLGKAYMAALAKFGQEAIKTALTSYAVSTAVGFLISSMFGW